MKNGKKVWMSPDIGIHGLLGEEEFREELRKERLRLNRSSRALTLVLFRVKPAGNRQAEQGQFLEILGSAVAGTTRACETKGWYRNGRGAMVGLILYETPPEQSSVVVERVRGQFRSAMEHSFGAVGRSVEILAEIQSCTAGDLREVNGDPSSGDRRSNAKDSELAGPEILNLARPIPFWKRSVDVLGALAAIVVSLPITIPVALLIKMISPGPVFFKQTRIGFRGRPFCMLKFRTMKPNADTTKHKEHLARLIREEGSNGSGKKAPAMVKLEDDPQIIPGGRVIRALCIDELPQLINVLRGEMSLVGPRPPIPYEAQEYSGWHKQRFDVVPGMTGLWQVSGKNDLSFNQMVRLDINYANSLSPLQDTKILLNTLPAIANQVRGKRRKSDSTMEATPENA
jgi:lipopolysaccharide/colanic/teichoic acid biosynthesis glycosyltransferase